MRSSRKDAAASAVTAAESTGIVSDDDGDDIDVDLRELLDTLRM